VNILCGDIVLMYTRCTGVCVCLCEGVLASMCVFSSVLCAWLCVLCVCLSLLQCRAFL